MSKKVAVGALALLLVAAGVSVTGALGYVAATLTLLGLLVTGVGVITLDTNQQIRRQGRAAERRHKDIQRHLAALEKQALHTTYQTATEPGELLGTIKLLQQQYLGRLDRSQTELEHAAAALREIAQSTDPSVPR